MALYEVGSDGTLIKKAGIGANNAIIDQNTNALNKFWTGTLAEYNALATHDANTFYNITDDVDLSDYGFHYSYPGVNVLGTNLSTIDLSNYITNYNSSAEYEIYFRLYGASGYNVNIYTDLFNESAYSVYGGSGDFAPTTQIIPAKRYIYVKKNNSTYMQIELRGWRRVK